MSTLLAFIPAYEHTLRGHPENANRLKAVWELLEQENVLPDLFLVKATKATVEQLTRAHTPQLVDIVSQSSQYGGGHLDADTYVTSESYDLASFAAGTTCSAVDQIMTGQISNGFALIRPPGHHAEVGRVGGFCLFNNIAIAARHAQVVHGVERVLIIDFDVHHGNGTQDIFLLDSQVLFISMHMFSQFFYPGTGAADEIGASAGRGATLNVPFGPGAGDYWYKEVFQQLIWPKASQFEPEIILVSAGFDAHWKDPLAAAVLSLTGYSQISREIQTLAEELCDGKLLYVLEGGYHLDALSHGVLNVLYNLLDRDEILDPLGPSPKGEANMSPIIENLRKLHLLE